MSSYWEAEGDIVRIGEEQISIPADQGLTHTVAASSRKVSFVVPKSTEFIDGKSCYLEFDAVIDDPVAAHSGGNREAGVTRLQVDPAGCGMMVENLRIYSLDDRVLLEEIVGYNQLVALKSDYDTDESIKGMKALTQGGTDYHPACSSSRGASKSDMADVLTNPWFKKVTDGGVAIDTAYSHTTMKNTVKACVPLDISGIFSGSIYPNMMTGLYIELDFMPAPRIIRQLDSVLKDRRRTLNPILAGVNATPAGGAAADGPTLISNGGDVTLNHVYFMCAANSCSSVEKFPFVVGEVIRFVQYDSAAAVESTFTNGNAGAQTDFRIGQIEKVNLAWDPAGGAGTWDYIKVIPDVATLQLANAVGNLEGVAGTGLGRATQSCAISTGFRDATSLSLSYTVSNLNLVVAEVKLDPRYKQQMMAKAREGSSIEFDIYSTTNYKNSLLASERQASFQVHALNSRAKSIIILPTDSSVYGQQALVSSDGTYEVTQDEMDITLNSARSGISGCCDFLSSVQFQIDGKMVPSRPVDTRKVATRKSISAIHLFELEKTLDNSGIMPRDFSKFMSNFVVGRGFAVNQGVFDLRNKDLICNLDYSETTAPTKPKMFSSFVCHLRRIVIKQGYVQVVM